MALQESLLVSCFKKNAAIAAFPGALEIGEVKVNKSAIIFQENKSFIVPLQKLPEFYALLQQLGKNVATEGAENFELQLSGKVLVLEETRLKIIKNEIDVFSIMFDGFIFMDFLTTVSKLVLLVSMPTQFQFETMKRYTETYGFDTENKFPINVKKILGTVSCSAHEMVLLEQFMHINKTVILFFCEISKIVNTNK